MDDQRWIENYITDVSTIGTPPRHPLVVSYIRAYVEEFSHYRYHNDMGGITRGLVLLKKAGVHAYFMSWIVFAVSCFIEKGKGTKSRTTLDPFTRTFVIRVGSIWQDIYVLRLLRRNTVVTRCIIKDIKSSLILVYSRFKKLSKEDMFCVLLRKRHSRGDLPCDLVVDFVHNCLLKGPNPSQSVLKCICELFEVKDISLLGTIPEERVCDRKHDAVKH